ADVDAHGVEGLDRRLVVEEPRDERARAGVVARADDQRFGVLGAQRVDVRGQVLGSAGGGADAAGQGQGPRGREVAVEVVDAEQLDVDGPRLWGLVALGVRLCRGGDDEQGRDGKGEGARSHGANYIPTPGRA